MENSIIGKISSIIISEPKKEEKHISLIEYIDLMNYINNKILSETKDFIKKINNKLSNNFAFFNYEIKSLRLTDKIIIKLYHELKTEEVIVSPKTFKIISNLKNKEIFEEIISLDLKNILEILRQYNYLNKVSIKTKLNDLNVIIGSETIELFMHKSPNWITMGKAFSLKYYISEKKYKYEIDSIDLEKNIKGQEKLLFSKILFDKELLPIEMQEINKNYKEIETKKPKNLVRIIIDKLKFLGKK